MGDRARWRGDGSLLAHGRLATEPNPPEPADDKPTDDAFVTPCAAPSPELTAARAELSDLTQAINALPVVGDPKPLVARMDELLRTTCFAVGSLTRSEEFTSSVSLKTFWDDGGESWASGE